MSSHLHTLNSSKDEAEPESWLILASNYVYENDFFKVRQDSLKLPSGRLYDNYFVIERSRGALIFCLSADSTQLLLTRQYKHGIGRILWELPAGAIDDGETAEQGAIRELREETGFQPKSGKLEHITSFVTDASSSSNEYDIFFTQDINYVEGSKDINDLEIIQCQWVKLEDVLSMIGKEIVTGSHIAAIMHVLNKKKLLQLAPA